MPSTLFTGMVRLGGHSPKRNQSDETGCVTCSNRPATALVDISLIRRSRTRNNLPSSAAVMRGSEHTHERTDRSLWASSPMSYDHTPGKSRSIQEWLSVLSLLLRAAVNRRGEAGICRSFHKCRRGCFLPVILHRGSFVIVVHLCFDYARHLFQCLMNGDRTDRTGHILNIQHGGLWAGG